MLKLEKATQPTMYFIGVTTGKSSIMKVFPEWAEALGLKRHRYEGDRYRRSTMSRKFTARWWNSSKTIRCPMGALVTTHKIDLYNAAKGHV